MERAPRDLVVGPALAGALGALRTRGGVSEPASLNLDRLQDVEAALGIAFEDDLLALFASGVPEFREMSMELAQVVALTGDIRVARLRGDLIGVGRTRDRRFVCVELRRQTVGETKLVVVDPLGELADERTTVCDFVLGYLGDSPPAEFCARLFRPSPESTNHGRRVFHKVFGEGRAVSERGTGPTRQVKVDFPAAGLKTLHGRFLEYLDD